MSIACEGCGSTLNLDPLAPRWRCDQCGRTNVNPDVVAAALRPHPEPNRAPTLVDLGRIEFEAGDYKRALGRFEEALVENPKDGEVWGLTAIATIRAANIVNESEFARARAKARRCIERAQQAGASDPFIAAVSEHIEAFILRGSLEAVRRARVIPRVNMTPEEHTRRNHELTEAIQTALATIQQSRAPSDDRFDAALQLRQLNADHARFLRGYRDVAHMLDILLAQLAEGQIERTRKLAAIREGQRVLAGIVVILAVLVAAVIVAVVFVNLATR